MAVKKTTSKKDESASPAPAQAEAKEAAPKKPAKAKAPAPAAAAPPPPPTPEPAPEPAAAAKPKASAPKKAAAAPIKLSPSQGELLKKIGEAADEGYTLGKKVEQRSLDSLLEKKLIKKGAKDKASGAIRYHISSAGKKHGS